MKNNKKKILALLPSTILYGKERSNLQVYNLISEEFGLDLKILANKRANLELNEYLKKYNTTYITFPSRTHLKLRYIRYILEVIFSNIVLIYYLTKYNPNIIFINTEYNFYDYFFPLKFTKAKIIYRIGDAPAYPLLRGNKINSFMWRKLVVDKTSKIISISDYIYKKVNNTGRNSINDIVIYNYPPYRLAVSNELEKSKYRDNIDDKIIRIGFLGQIIEKKGVYLLLKACKRLQDEDYKFILYLAGDLSYDLEYSKKLNLILKEFKNTENIIFLDEIESLDIFFKNIDILCVTSTYPEPLGNVIVEGKLHHTPCIITPSGGMPELIEHLETGYICEDISADSIYNAILFYIKNSHLIKEQGEAAFESIEKLKIGESYFKENWRKIFTDI